MPTDADEERLRVLYDALNTHDLRTALAALTTDVDWPDAWRGGRLRGREEVAAHWRAQWQDTGPCFSPVDITALDDGRVAVDLRYEVLETDGTVLLEGTVRHVHRFREGRVSRMDVEEPPPGAAPVTR